MPWNPPELTRGERIRKAREDAGLRKDQLEERARVSRQTLNAWESGATGRINDATLAAVVRVLAPLQPANPDRPTEAELEAWIRGA